MAAVQVIARLRPPKSENVSLWVESSDSQVLYHVDNQRVALAGPGSRKCARFSSPILCEACNSSSQSAAFAQLKSLVSDAVCKGISATVLCFGQTGSGKTYTLCGPTPDSIAERQNDEERGVLLRSAEEVFHQAKVLSFGPCSRHRKVEVAMSVLEVYCEQPVDLLADSSVPAKPSSGAGSRGMSLSGTLLRVQMGSTGTMHVNGLTTKPVASSAEVAQNLQLALSRRKTSPTLQNAESSRSHLLVTLDISVSDLRTGQVAHSKVRLVDLAGSEHAKRSQANGERLQEASAINTSLSTLSRVITALVDKQRAAAGGDTGARIPYRDSMLTRLLADSLGANNAPCRTAVILCLSPDAADYEQSRSTLEFGERARLVVNRAVEPAVSRMSLLPPSTAGLARAEAEATQYATVLRATAAENELLRQAVLSLGLDPAQLLATIGAGGRGRGTQAMSRTGSLGSTFASVDAWLGQPSSAGAGTGEGAASSSSVMKNNKTLGNMSYGHASALKPPTPTSKRTPSASTPSRPPPSTPVRGTTTPSGAPVRADIPAFMRGTASSSAKRSHSSDAAADSVASLSAQGARSAPRGRTSSRSGPSASTPASSRSTRSASRGSSSHKSAEVDTLHGRSRSASAGSRTKSALALEAVMGSTPSWDATSLPLSMPSQHATVPAAAAPPRIALISPLGQVIDCNAAWQEARARSEEHAAPAGQPETHQGPAPDMSDMDAGAVSDDLSDEEAREAAAPVEAELWPADTDEVEFSLPAAGTAPLAVPLPTSPSATSMQHTGGTLSRHSSMASILSVEEVVVPWEEDEAAAAVAPSTTAAQAQLLPSAPSFTSVPGGRVSSPGLMFMSPVQAPQPPAHIAMATSPLFLTGTAIDAATSPLLPASHQLPAAVQNGQGQSVQTEEDAVLAEAIRALLTQTTDVNSLQRTLRAALAEVASLRVALRGAVSDNRVLATQLADGPLSSPVQAQPRVHQADEHKWEGHTALSSPGMAMFASGILSPANAAASVQPSLFSPFASVPGDETSHGDSVDNLTQPLRLVSASAQAGVECIAAQMAVVQVELAAATAQCAALSSELEGEKVARFQAEDLVSASEGWCSVLETQVKDLQLSLEAKQQKLLDAEETVDALKAQLYEAQLSLVDSSQAQEADKDEEAQDVGSIPAASEGIDCDVEAMDSHLLQLALDADEAEAALHAYQVQDLQERLSDAQAALHAAQAGMEGQAARASMAETVLTLMVQTAPDSVHKLRARIDSLEQYCLALEKQLVESDEYALKLKAVFVAREAALAVQVQHVTAERDEAVANLQQVGEEASSQHAELYSQLQSTQESLVEYEFCAFLMRDWALRLLEELEAQDTERSAAVEATHAELQTMLEADIPAAVLRIMDAHAASIAAHVEEEGALLQTLADSLPTLEEAETDSISDLEEEEEERDEESRSESRRLQDAVVSSVIALLRARAAQVAPLQASIAAQHLQLKELMEEVDIWQSKAGQACVDASHMRTIEAELDQARAQAKASDRLLMERATEMNKLQRKIIALQAASAVSARTSEAKVPLSLLQAAEAQLVDNRRQLEEAACREADHEHRLAMYDQWALVIGAPEPSYPSDNTADAEHVLVVPTCSEADMDVALACADMAVQAMDMENAALQALADSMTASYELFVSDISYGQDELEVAHSDLAELRVAALSQVIETLRARSAITDAVLPILIGKSSAQITLLQTALRDAYGGIAAAQQKDLASQACIAALRRQQDALSQAIAEHLADLTSYKAKIALESKARQKHTEDVEQKAALYEGWCLQLLEPDMPLWDDSQLTIEQEEQGWCRDWTLDAEVLLARVDAGLAELEHANAFLSHLSESCSALFYAVDAVIPDQEDASEPQVGKAEAQGEYRVQLMEAVIAALHARADAASAAHLEVLQMQRSAQAMITRLQQQLLATQAALLGAGRANSNPAYVSMVQDLQAQVNAANTRACSALQRAQTAESEVLSVRGALAALEAVVEASSSGLRQQYAELKVLQAENDALKGRVSSTADVAGDADGDDDDGVDEDGEAAPPWVYAPSKEEQAQKMAQKLARDMAAAHVQRVQAGWRATEAELRESATQLQARLESAHRERAEALTELAKAKQGMKDLQAVVATAQAAAAADAKARAGPVALPSTTPGKPHAAARAVSRAVAGEEGPLGALKQRVGKMVAFAGAAATPAKVSGRASGAGLHDVTSVTRQAVSAVKATPQTSQAMPMEVPTATPAKVVQASVQDGSPLTDSSPVTVSSDIDELDLTVATQTIAGGRVPSAPGLSVSHLGMSRMGASAVGGGANDTVLDINGSMLLMSPALNLTGLGRSTARPTFDSPVHMFGSAPEEDGEGGAGATPSLQSTQRGTKPLPPMTGQLLAAAMAVSPIDVATKQRFTSPPVLGLRSPSDYNLTSPATGGKSKVAGSTAKMTKSAVKMYNRAISAEGRAMATNDENSPGLVLSNLV